MPMMIARIIGLKTANPGRFRRPSAKPAIAAVSRRPGQTDDAWRFVALAEWLIERSAEPVPEPSPGYKVLMAETPLISANRVIPQLIDPTHVLAQNNKFSE
jgi:hypothetical protein